MCTCNHFINRSQSQLHSAATSLTVLLQFWILEAKQKKHTSMIGDHLWTSSSLK